MWFEKTLIFLDKRKTIANLTTSILTFIKRVSRYKVSHVK